MAALAEKNTAPIAVERLCAEITRALPGDGVLVADTGYSGIWTGTMIDLNGAGQTYLRAAGSLGWAFPASLGAQCAAGPRKVVCFTGDGGFYYHLAELEIGAALPHPGDDRHQQQFRLRPEPDRRAPHLGQPSGARRGADPLRSDRFHRSGEKLRRARHPGRAAAGHRAGAAAGARRRRAGRRRCRHRSRTARSGSLVAAGRRAERWRTAAGNASVSRSATGRFRASVPYFRPYCQALPRSPHLGGTRAFGCWPADRSPGSCRR